MATVINEDEIVQELRKKGIQVHQVHSMVVLPNSRKVGLKVWGLVDCLINNFDYNVTTKKKRKKTK